MDEGGLPLLPDSLVYQIFLSLGPADVLAAGLVCRQWQAVSRDEFLWKEQFYRYYQVARDVPRHPAATSWYEEFRRLYDMVPCVEVQTLKEHTDQVLHLSFSHSGYQFASCSKDCTVKIWNNDLTISLLHSADMRPYNWSYTQFSQFNQDDSLLLASGVFLGPHNSSSGEIAVIMLIMLGIFFNVHSAVLIEDVPFTEKDFENGPQNIYNLYEQVSYNCFIAAGLYLLLGGFSFCQVRLNKRKEYMVR